MKVTNIAPNISFNFNNTPSGKLSFSVERVMLLSFCSLSDAFALAGTCKSLRDSVKVTLPKTINRLAIQLKGEALQILKSNDSIDEKRKKMEHLLINFLRVLETDSSVYSNLHLMLATNPEQIEPNNVYNLAKTLKEIQKEMIIPCKGYIDLKNPKLRALFYHMYELYPEECVAKNWIESFKDKFPTDLYKYPFDLKKIYKVLKNSKINLKNLKKHSIFCLDLMTFSDLSQASKMVPLLERIEVEGFLSQENFDILKTSGKIIDARKTHSISFKEEANISFRIIRKSENLCEFISDLIFFLIIGIGVGLATFSILNKISKYLVWPLLFLDISAGAFLLAASCYGLLVFLSLIKLVDKIKCNYFRLYIPPKMELIKA